LYSEEKEQTSSNASVSPTALDISASFLVTNTISGAQGSPDVANTDTRLVPGKVLSLVSTMYDGVDQESDDCDYDSPREKGACTQEHQQSPPQGLVPYASDDGGREPGDCDSVHPESPVFVPPSSPSSNTSVSAPQCMQSYCCLYLQM